MEGGGGVSTAAPALAAVPATDRTTARKTSVRRAHARPIPVSVKSLSCSSRCRMFVLPFLLWSPRKDASGRGPRFSVAAASPPIAARAGGFASSDELLALGARVAVQERQSR